MRWYNERKCRTSELLYSLSRRILLFIGYEVQIKSHEEFR